MIVNFTVGNFLSFKDKMTLSFEASAIQELESNVVEYKGKKLLRSAVIYGANSSGKSNLIKAIARMKEVLMGSVKLNPTDPLKYDPFRLSTETEGQTTFFEIQFYKEDALYRYGFEYNLSEIVNEWLFVKNADKKKEEALFIRTPDGISISESFPEGQNKEEDTNDNRLFLSFVAQHKTSTISQSILGWFDIRLSIASGIDHKEHEDISSFFIQEKELSEVLGNQQLFQSLKLGFKDIQAKEQDDKIKLETTHSKYDSEGLFVKDELFDCEKQESEGTKKIIHLSVPILGALFTGKFLVIDELDAKLHPILTQEIIHLFNDPEKNPKNAQFLFATHDTNLLSGDLFRRDQIWFTEKDDMEQTDLYSLVDIKMPDGTKVRNDSNLEKNYIRGRYGAIPYISNK